MLFLLAHSSVWSCHEPTRENERLLPQSKFQLQLVISRMDMYSRICWYIIVWWLLILKSTVDHSLPFTTQWKFKSITILCYFSIIDSFIFSWEAASPPASYLTDHGDHNIEKGCGNFIEVKCWVEFQILWNYFAEASFWLLK